MPGYGDHLESTVDLDIHTRQADAPEGFEDVIGALVPLRDGEPPHSHVTFTVSDPDKAAAAAEQLGGTVLARRGLRLDQDDDEGRPRVGQAAANRADQSFPSICSLDAQCTPPCGDIPPTGIRTDQSSGRMWCPAPSGRLETCPDHVTSPSRPPRQRTHHHGRVMVGGWSGRSRWLWAGPCWPPWVSGSSACRHRRGAGCGQVRPSFRGWSARRWCGEAVGGARSWSPW